MGFFNKRTLFIFLIGFIIFAALIGLSLSERENLSKPEQFVQDTVGWVQNIIYKPVNSIVNTFNNIKDIKNVYEENKVLREKIAEYKSIVYDVQELKKDNDELRDILDKQESIFDYQPIHATVTSRSPERWVSNVTVNKGSKHGVKDNMAVITADGMIGKIQNTSQFTSTVQLLTGFDQFNQISAMISRDDEKDVFGIIENYDEETESLLFKIIEESEQNVEKGEIVVSSGMGGVFPAGLTIGTVEEVVPDRYGLTKTARVKPAADLYRINHVIIVDRLLDQEDNEGNEEE
ncbi:MAG TPA: rod shape-determining protein MreC [Bacillota bacterium]|nr:rod shape-determining protein MreC [Bacillota bacterium]